MRSLFFACGLIFAAATASGQSIDPGTSLSLSAETCATDQGSFCGGECAASCNLSGNTAKVWINDTGLLLGPEWAVAAVRTDFSIAAADDGAATPLDATVFYDIEWRGLWAIAGVATGFNDAKTEITLTLKELPSGTVVRSVLVHDKDVDGFLDVDIIGVGAGTDAGSSVNSFSARVVRGRSYRLELVARAELKSARNATITLDYIAPGLGAWWNSLRMSVGRDFAEELEELTRLLEELTARVEALEGHTHTYLTGTGEGQNNPEVETTTPIMEEPQDDSGAEQQP